MAQEQPGFCAIAPSPSIAPGACQSDDMGSWSSHSMSDCIDRCQHCERCRYVSFSAKTRTCAWYTYCDTNDLRTFWLRALPSANWSTVHVRKNSVPLAVSNWRDEPGAKPLSLAIATLAFGGDYCAMGLWCQAANRLKRALDEPWMVQATA